eukprot:scaffold138548_cov24-Tisochrysis_lutea.AAC.5
MSMIRPMPHDVAVLRSSSSTIRYRACSDKAMLRSSGANISGTGLHPQICLCESSGSKHLLEFLPSLG